MVLWHTWHDVMLLVEPQLLLLRASSFKANCHLKASSLNGFFWSFTFENISSCFKLFDSTWFNIKIIKNPKALRIPKPTKGLFQIQQSPAAVSHLHPTGRIDPRLCQEPSTGVRRAVPELGPGEWSVNGSSWGRFKTHVWAICVKICENLDYMMVKSC